MAFYAIDGILDYYANMPAPERTKVPSQSTLTADQLRRRYIAALSLIALLTIFSQGVVQSLLSDQEYDSRVINIAGRQRMLSQKITKTSFYVTNADSPESSKAFRQQLTEILSLWERSHQGLLHGDVDLGLRGRHGLLQAH